MKNKEIIGIDVSKNVLDIYIMSLDFHFIVKNNPTGFARLLETCCIKLSCKKDKLYFYFENTGRYSMLLSVFFQDNTIEFTVINPLDLKRSMGLNRGKSDKKDAKTIALYGCRKRNELEPTKLNSTEVSQLRQLISLRDKYIKHRTAYKNSLCDLQDCFIEGETQFIRLSQEKLIQLMNQEIEAIENQIDQIIESLPEWKHNYNLIKTVQGIGDILAKYIIIYTENFTRFNNAKKFACFSGIAPFEYSSGSSVKGRTRVHPFANKHLKSLLNLAAMGSIRYQNEYKTYYDRRTAEGKNKMSTLNIIRNKLVARVFAVVKRGTPFVNLSKFAA